MGVNQIFFILLYIYIVTLSYIMRKKWDILANLRFMLLNFMNVEHIQTISYTWFGFFLIFIYFFFIFLFSFGAIVGTKDYDILKFHFYITQFWWKVLLLSSIIEIFLPFLQKFFWIKLFVSLGNFRPEIASKLYWKIGDSFQSKNIRLQKQKKSTNSSINVHFYILNFRKV